MIVIAEKINATLSSVKKLIEDRDTKALLDLAQKQADAGASYIDVNVGTGVGSREREIQAMGWAVAAIQDKIETPLCLDSADPDVLKAGLEARQGKPSMINSAKAESESLDAIIPLAAEYKAPVVALTMDEQGMPRTVEDRMRACEKIVAACDRYGVPVSDVFFDPLLMPVSTDAKQGLVTLRSITRIKSEYPECKTTLGLSNVSYGLPSRTRLNAGFLHMAIYAGLDSAILDPLNREIMAAAATAEALAGKDRHCRRYMRMFRN